ncbi:MAG TPA: squalene/phytoene synthase family protein [Steroidobacteraceae bacterium]
MRPLLKNLDATYRARAIPAGSARYWSWLFAAAPARPPLLGIYALLAEWNALTDPATEHSAAQIKLAWWQEEIRRLAAGMPVHPIGIYLAALPRAGEADFARLAASIDAAVIETNGVPLERSTELEPHACALRAPPLALASRLITPGLDDNGMAECAQALAVADYLSRATRDYRRDVQLGRVPFPVDDLLAAGVDNIALRAEHAPPPLEKYLAQLRQRARENYDSAARALPAPHRTQLRHLLILAALGLKHLMARTPSVTSTGMRDMLLAWSTARRA